MVWRPVRLYELIVGEMSAIISGMSFAWPATYCWKSLLIPYSPLASGKRLFFPSLSQSDWWRWPEQPGRFWLTLAMKVTITP
jgi:hypothetical protein